MAAPRIETFEQHNSSADEMAVKINTISANNSIPHLRTLLTIR